MLTTDQNNNTESLFAVSGDQGAKWLQAFTTIGDSEMTSDYMVQIVATINNVVTSDISIDDIKTTPGSCTISNKPPTGKLYLIYLASLYLFSRAKSIHFIFSTFSFQVRKICEPIKSYTV